MTNKTLGIGLIVTLILTILIAIFEAGMHPSSSEMLYSLAGLGMFFFGIWGGIRLTK